jgi:hypothetical protein
MVVRELACLPLCSRGSLVTARANYAFYKRRRQFKEIMASNPGLNRGRYFRLMALSSLDAYSRPIPISLYYIVHMVKGGLVPWKSWDDTHASIPASASPRLHLEEQPQYGPVARDVSLVARPVCVRLLCVLRICRRGPPKLPSRVHIARQSCGLLDVIWHFQRLIPRVSQD